MRNTFGSTLRMTSRPFLSKSYNGLSAVVV
jgi:hypothetical protein